MFSSLGAAYVVIELESHVQPCETIQINTADDEASFSCSLKSFLNMLCILSHNYAHYFSTG